MIKQIPYKIWKKVVQFVCGCFTHKKYTVDPTNYTDMFNDKHEGEVPIWICERCDKAKWVNEEKVK